MIKFGICHFSLPVEGPYALKIALEAGFDGVQLDMIRNYKNQLALSKKITQEAFLYLGKKYNIEFPSIVVRELDQQSMVIQNNDIAVDAIKKAINAAANMKIQGNTDYRGSHEYNLSLGQKRAVAVKEALNSFGVDDSQIETVSYGKEYANLDCVEQNSCGEDRRADIVYTVE